jgi:DNA-binding CsgD family transcriptional regulator
MSTEAPIHKLSSLTPRQREVLRLFCDGFSYRQIADQHVVSENTIKAHMGNIYVKLGLDMLPAAQRRRALHQVFCPALERLEQQPEAFVKTEEPEELGLLPVVVWDMVEEDERAIIPMPPREIIEIKTRSSETNIRPSKLRWFLFGLFAGILITGGILYAGWRVYRRFVPVVAIVRDTPLAPVTTSAAEDNPLAQTTQPAINTPSDNDNVFVSESPSPEALTPEFPPPPQVSILFQDNFDGGLSPYWQVITGSPVIVNGMLTADQDTWLAVGDASWTDYVIEFNADAADCWFSWSYNTLAARFVNSSSMIAWRWADCESYWYVVENGSWNEVPNSNAGPGYDMLKFRITVKDNQFAVFVGDQLLSSFFSDRYNQGKVGLQLAPDTLIDNFVIKASLD